MGREALAKRCRSGSESNEARLRLRRQPTITKMQFADVPAELWVRHLLVSNGGSRPIPS